MEYLQGKLVPPPSLDLNHGKTVQVDRIEPALKAPGIHLLTLKYDEPLSTFAFNFNLRRYTTTPAPS
jgi:hypothetical protein